MIQSAADYMAEWENVPRNPKTIWPSGRMGLLTQEVKKTKTKQLVNVEPPRPVAARLTIECLYIRTITLIVTVTFKDSYCLIKH